MTPPEVTARQVAKHLDRRQVRRKIIVWFVALAAIVVAIMYGTCGGGWGFGKGSGDGDGKREAVTKPPDEPRRCAIFVAKEGITVDGTPATRDQVVATCKRANGADVIVAGDARRGDWDDLKAALDAARIEVFKREAK